MLRIPRVFVNVCVLRMCQEVANSHLPFSPLSTFDGKSQEDTASISSIARLVKMLTFSSAATPAIFLLLPFKTSPISENLYVVEDA